MQGRRNTPKEEYDKVSQLIWCVRQRPALFNYKLAPQDRRRIDIAKGWKDVAEELGGSFSADECRKKWKNLRDTYHQYRLRKSKYKDCLEKWRYREDMAFLADIYQPKLKSERGKYAASVNGGIFQIDEVKISSIASMIDIDESSIVSFQKIEDDETLIEDDYDDDIEHVIDMDEVQFCDVDAVGETGAERRSEEAYSEVCLYEESETNAVPVDTLEETDYAERKFRTVSSDLEKSESECTKKVHLIIGNETDELDLFFQFLKTKIQKLPPVDITSIQIEFLNAVLRKESANAASS